MRFEYQKFFLGIKSHFNHGLLILLGLVLCGSVFLWVNTAELLPNFWTACGTLFFAYFAYLHTREKFRLDLLSEREKVYEAIHEFGYRAKALTLIYDNVMESEVPAMIGHAKNLTDTCFDLRAKVNEIKLKRLFGPEVISYYTQLSELFSAVYSDITWWDLEIFDKNEQQLISNIKALVTHTEKADALFSPYLYFGQYRLSI